MTNVCRCCNCTHFKKKEAPQGTCEVTRLPMLAWCGCTYDWEAKEVAQVEK